jgi:hypothetical protein
MTLLQKRRIAPLGWFTAVGTAPALAVLVGGAAASPAAATEPTAPLRVLGPRMLPMLELGSHGGRKSRPPAGVSNAGLLLERGVFGPLPDVPDALQTTHLRDNNRGHVVGAYVDDSDGALRQRGFLMRGRDVTRIDVPGALVTLPLGINDRSQIGIAAAGTTDGTTCPPQGGDA